MKTRNLTQDEKNRIIEFYADGDKDIERLVIEDIDKALILSAIDTKVGTYIVFLNITIDTIDDTIDKQLDELLIHYDGKIEDVKNWEFLS